MDLPALATILGAPGVLALGAGAMKLYDRFSTARKERAEREAAERKLAADRELAEDEAQRKHAMDLGAALASGAVAQERLSGNVASLITVIEAQRGELSGHHRTLAEIDSRGARLEASATERAARMHSVVEEQRASNERIERTLLVIAGDMRELLALTRASQAPPPPRPSGFGPPPAPLPLHPPQPPAPAAGDVR